MFGLTVLQFAVIIFGFGILVLVHEIGHLLGAKLFKVPVEKFTIGFGKEIVGITYKETRYSLCWIPLGGMTKLPGEDAGSATGSPDEFLSQAWYKRFVIAILGPLMNYILAAIVFAIVIYFWGIASPSADSIIGSILPGKPAESAGLQAGDRILSINNKNIVKWEEMAGIIYNNKNNKLKFEIKRNNKKLVINITPEHDSITGKGIIGITPGYTIEKVGLKQSMIFGVKACLVQSIITVRYLADKIIRWEKPEVAGPIGVAQILASAAKSGFEQILHILAIISVALGLFNLFPIPLVDGGHIVFSLIEAITRKPVNKKVLTVANTIGLSLIIAIFLLATYNDLSRLGLNFTKFLK